jgi:hypothetical protein
MENFMYLRAYWVVYGVGDVGVQNSLFRTRQRWRETEERKLSSLSKKLMRKLSQPRREKRELN